MSVVIYGRNFCPYCHAAVSLCHQEGISYEYRCADSGTQAEKELLEFSEKYNHFTIPLIMEGDRFIGGYDDFREKHKNKGL